MRNSSAAVRPSAKGGASQIPVALDGNALRSGPSASNIRLEDLFSTLEENDFEQLTILHRARGTLVSGLRRDVVNGRKFQWKLMRLGDGLFVRSSNSDLGHSAVFPINGEGLIEFHFRLSGKLSLSHDAGDDTDLAVESGSLLIWRQPEGCDVNGRVDAPEREASLTIYLKPSALQHYFGEHADSMPADLTRKLCCENGDLFALRLAPPPKLTQLVHEFLALDVTGPVRLVQAEAIVMLVLCETVAMLADAPHDSVLACRITDIDMRCLRRAREILQERYVAPPTIECLAREVGLGTTKLKNGFKSLFGTTISQFVNEIRMVRARELLCKPDVQIANVAETLGYGYQNSFTAAFRRHYGVLPKDYRRDPMILRM